LDAGEGCAPSNPFARSFYIDFGKITVSQRIFLVMAHYDVYETKRLNHREPGIDRLASKLFIEQRAECLLG
jgi:hypothetical protein